MTNKLYIFKCCGTCIHLIYDVALYRCEISNLVLQETELYMCQCPKYKIRPYYEKGQDDWELNDDD
jgi:hypothetical protein